MSQTKVIICLVGFLVAGLIFGRVSEVVSSPFKIVDKLLTCDGSSCSYTVEIKNRSFEELEGVLSIETYSTVDNLGVSTKKLDHSSAKSFSVEPSDVTVVEGEFESTEESNQLVFEALIAKVNW